MTAFLVHRQPSGGGRALLPFTVPPLPLPSTQTQENNMDGYVCADCKQAFDMPLIQKDGGGDVGEDWFVCPHCGSDEIDEAKDCALCGQTVRTLDMCVHGNGDICVFCMEKIVEEARQLLKDAFSKEDYEAIADYLSLNDKIV